jgi:hypothetical protein
MAELKIPSLQHLVRNWYSDPARIQKELVRLVNNPPTFSYSPLFGAVRDMLVLHVPYDQIVEGIKRGVKRKSVQDMLLAVLPLIREHFDGLAPDFVQQVERRYYPVGRGLMIPFEPPLVYGMGGQLYFPWFSFWRRNPLADERLSLFVTLVDELLLQDPDLETARFDILDFSAPKDKAPRELKIIPASEIPRVSDERKVEMLETFVDGYLMAKAYLEHTPKPSKGKDGRDEPPPPDHPDLFR